VAKPSGNNMASFGGNEGKRIVNRNILLCQITPMRLEAFKR
jgi:hypothetical protein